VKRVVVAAVVAAVLFPAAAAEAGGPAPGTLRDGEGIAVAGGLRLVAGDVMPGTTVVRLVRSGRTVARRTLAGKLGIPLATFAGPSDARWQGGRRVLLATSVYDDLRTTTFVVLDTRTLRTVRTVRLRGAFAYDALSPDGRVLYAVQFRSGLGTSYVVRSVSLVTGRLYPGTIVDKTAPDELMTGLPVARARSADGGRVYTLYVGGLSHAFVHALDTREGAARCIDLPWHGSAQGLETARLALSAGDLVVRQPGVGVLARVDLHTFRVVVERPPVVPRS
jgi:hypothetical protein